MKKIIFLLPILFICQLKAQDGINLLEKELFQPEVWSLPSYDKGTVDQSGHYNKTLNIAEIINPNGLGISVNINYNSNIKYRQSSGWLGLGWSYNPGTITRSVHGGLADEYEWESYNENVKEQVDFPSLIENHSIDEEKDDTKDLYYLTLPNGKTIECMQLDGITNYGNLSQVNPPICSNQPQTTTNYEEYQFFPMNGENLIIRGYYNSNTPITVCGLSTAGKYFNPDWSQRDESDFVFFLVTDENGHTYKYAKPTLGSLNEEIGYEPGGAYFTWYSIYVNTWRIVKIYYSTSIEDLFAGNGNFSDSSILPEKIITFNYTTVQSTDSSFPNSLPRIPLYQICYLNLIEGYHQKIEFEFYTDAEKDHIYYTYLRSPADPVTRNRIDKIKMYEKEVGTANTFHLKTIDFNYLHPSSSRRYYLDELLFVNPSDETIEKYGFTYSNTGSFPAYHSTFNIYYENLNGYYSTAPLNLMLRNQRTDHVHYGQLTGIDFPSGKSETIIYEVSEVLFASNSQPYQGPANQGIELGIYHHRDGSSGYEGSIDAYFKGFYEGGPHDDDLKYNYSRVKRIVSLSSFDDALMIVDDYSYGDYEFAGLPANIILDELRFEDSGGTDRMVDYYFNSFGDQRYVFMSRKNPSEVYYRLITKITNDIEKVETKYYPIAGDPDPYPNTLPGNIYVNAGGDNVYYVSFFNGMWTYVGKIQEIKVTDLGNSTFKKDLYTENFALPASNINIFQDATEEIFTGFYVPLGLKFYNLFLNRNKVEGYFNTNLISEVYYDYDLANNKGNVIRKKVERQHNFGINTKTTPSTPSPTENYFSENTYTYAFENYSEMLTRNIISPIIEERQDTYLRTDIASTGTGTATYLGNKIFTYKKFNSKIWEQEYIYQNNTATYNTFNYADPPANEPNYSLLEHHQIRLDYGNDWVVYKPDYYIKYYYATNPVTPFSDDYIDPGYRLTGIGALKNFTYYPTKNKQNKNIESFDNGFRYSYLYDDFGRVVELKSEFNDETISFTYDNKLRLDSKSLNNVLLEEYFYELATDVGNTTNLNKIEIKKYYDAINFTKAITYIDGVAGEIQNQNGIDNDFVIRDNVFDYLLRKSGVTKAAHYTTSTLGWKTYIDHRVTSDPLFQLSGDILNFYTGNDGYYAYSLNTKDLFEFDSKNYFPGEYMRTNDIKVNTGTSFVSNLYKQEVITDQNALENYNLYNLTGLKFYSGNNSNLNTYFVYNPRLLLSKVYHPNNNVSEFLYNHQGNIVAKETPDQAAKFTSGSEPDISTNPDFKYLYDKYGKLRFSIDPNQSYDDVMTYTKYDLFNRIIEVGEITSVSNFNQTDADNPDFPSSGDWYVLYYYDDEFSLNNYTNQNTKMRISKKIDKVNNELYTTIYSYNTEGNVEWIIQKTPDGIKDEQFVDYDDQGNLLEYQLYYNNNEMQFLWFDYNVLGQLSNLYFNTTATQPTNSTLTYSYNAEGQIETVNMANGLQQVDYAYNILDWLTDINNVSTPGTDQFALKFQYWQSLPAGISARYNGDIATLQSKTPEYSTEVLTMGFTYDGLNRLGSSKTYTGSPADEFNTAYTYDIMGNISSIDRYHDSALMDDLGYTYSGNNKVTNITDAVSSSSFDFDFDQKGTGTYNYDANGNLVSDQNRDITNITYNHLNLPVSVQKTDGKIYEYGYDSEGNRLWKKEDGNLMYHYLRNSNANIVAELSESGDNTAMYFTFSAASGEGLLITTNAQTQTIVSSGDPISTVEEFTPGEMTGGISFKPSGTGPVSITSFHAKAGLKAKYVNIPGANNEIAGQRRFESSQQNDYFYLKDHLGNIRVQIKDDAAATVVASNDYYPFGFVMRNLQGLVSEEEDKYKFSGKERDLETKYDYFGARYYDPAIGRWSQVDQLASKYPSLSPYVYAANSPMIFVDPDGEDLVLVISGTHNGYVTSNNATKYSTSYRKAHKRNNYISWFKGDPSSGKGFYTFGMDVYDVDKYPAFLYKGVGKKKGSFDVARDAWMGQQTEDNQYGENNEARPGTYLVKNSKGSKGKPMSWFWFGDNGDGKISQDGRIGMSIHPGSPGEAQGCITMGYEQFLVLAGIVNKALSSGQQVFLIINGRRAVWNAENQRWEYESDENNEE